MSIQPIKGLIENGSAGGTGPVVRPSEAAGGNPPVRPSTAAPTAAPAASASQGRNVQPPQQVSEPGREEVTKAVQQIQQAVQTMTRSLQFSIDDESGKTVVTLTDSETGEVIRQVPSQEVIELASNIGRLQGMLVKQKA